MTSKVARNASWIIGCKLVQSILGFVLNMLTARFLGKSSFGDISYAMAVVSFVVPLMRLGFGNIMDSSNENKTSNEIKDKVSNAMTVSPDLNDPAFDGYPKIIWDFVKNPITNAETPVEISFADSR